MLVPVRPGGSFEAKTSALEGTLTLGAGKPLSLAGNLSAKLATIETGIALRDRHLLENYLEVSKGRGFDRVVLSEIVLADADGAGFAGRSAFTGTLLLHGVSAQVAGEAEIRPAGPTYRVQATFTLSLTDFAMEPPAYKGVGVANNVHVRVVFTAKPAQVPER